MRFRTLSARRVDPRERPGTERYRPNCRRSRPDNNCTGHPGGDRVHRLRGGHFHPQTERRGSDLCDTHACHVWVRHLYRRAQGFDHVATSMEHYRQYDRIDRELLHGGVSIHIPNRPLCTSLGICPVGRLDRISAPPLLFSKFDLEYAGAQFRPCTIFCLSGES